MLVAVLAASACVGSGRGTSHSTRGVAATDRSQGSRSALAYAAVVRQLVTKDHGFGRAPSPYRHVYVLDGIVPTAADPSRFVDRPARPFPDGLARQISAGLGSLPPVSFVRSRGFAIAGAGLGHVIHRGVLITLGRIEWVDAQTARVPNNRWATGLNGQWLTYTVRYDQSSWRVVGVSGDNVTIS